ncbi:hypothetical protein F1188_14885 [Roseospira marina]|uniref:Uncharacterized protein n=1 Tax=Roseospira marina TaxID=140057 RepID=A0A5M6IAE5_9PROT|nr:hypothetical protein [Roseospira marina]KAA5604695.1 hypothetical protein F1188_14885 [Roseospira marina]MBB4315143.1 hypothetical protein [Roseospira marina]MBB5088087.1 hypothetical protein [Roseospira marina]
MSYEQVEEAWSLIDEAMKLKEKSDGDLEPDAYWDPLFATSPLVDVPRTQSEGGAPLEKVFLKSPYGLQFRRDHMDWIPFRHGEVTLD